MDIFDYFKKIQDSMIDSVNQSISGISRSMSKGYRRPSCEISQSKDSLIIKASLPGISKREVLLKVTHNYLEIIAEKKGRREIRKKGEYRREERYIGYKRRIALPPGLITDKAGAKFKNGKLIVKIPKFKAGKIRVR